MSQKEANRIAVIDKVSQKQLTALQAASQLRISDRQVKRLVKMYRAEGASGLSSKKRGQPSNNRLPHKLREQCLKLIQEKYIDFGPTFAAEKLHELHGLEVSRESLRRWMIESELWHPKRGKINIHQTRARRSCYGDLIQIDGSPHDWFEGRAPRCSLLVWVDDATSALVGLRFESAETTFGYLDMLREYIDQHGIPVSLYSDKHSIFRQNHNNGEGEETQFTQALRKLEIEPIHANTPQAKGRVERANKTLQDRLVKELRLREISSMEEANAFLPDFIQSYNRRFAKVAQSAENAHRQSIHKACELDLICALSTPRVLSKNLIIQYKNTEYQLQKQHHKHRLRGRKVQVTEKSNGSITLMLDGDILNYTALKKGDSPIPLDDEKTIQERVDTAKKEQAAKGKWKPAPDHPLRNKSTRPKRSTRPSKRSEAKYYDHIARTYV